MLRTREAVLVCAGADRLALRRDGEPPRKRRQAALVWTMNSDAGALWRVNGQAAGQCRGLQAMNITGRREGMAFLAAFSSPAQPPTRFGAGKPPSLQPLNPSPISQPSSRRQLRPRPSPHREVRCRPIAAFHLYFSPNGIAAAPAIVKGTLDLKGASHLRRQLTATPQPKA